MASCRFITITQKWMPYDFNESETEQPPQGPGPLSFWLQLQPVVNCYTKIHLVTFTLWKDKMQVIYSKCAGVLLLLLSTPKVNRNMLESMNVCKEARDTYWSAFKVIYSQM